LHSAQTVRGAEDIKARGFRIQCDGTALICRTNPRPEFRQVGKGLGNVNRDDVARYAVPVLDHA
jgi:hypothetical protein